MDDLTVKHVQEFQKKKQKMDVFSQSEESFRYIAGTASKPIPITKYQFEYRLDSPEFSQVDQFSMSVMLIVEKLKVYKGSKNVFDVNFSQFSKNKDKMVVVKTYENSELVKDELQLSYYCKASVKSQG